MRGCPVLKKVYRLEDSPAPGLQVKNRPGIGLQFIEDIGSPERLLGSCFPQFNARSLQKFLKIFEGA